MNVNPIRYFQRLRADYRATFVGTASGERVLADFHNYSGADKQSFVESPYQTAFNEGKRRMWLHVAKRLDMTDEEISRITKIEGVTPL